MPTRTAERKLPSQIVALRALAKKVEASGEGLSPELADAVTEALEDREDLEAVRDAHVRLARGEKTIPAAEVRRKLGI